MSSLLKLRLVTGNTDENRHVTGKHWAPEGGITFRSCSPTQFLSLQEVSQGPRALLRLRGLRTIFILISSPDSYWSYFFQSQSRLRAEWSHLTGAEDQGYIC
jgi:hypothetical protein